MNIHQFTRDSVRDELRRFIPPAHYWLREHEPVADLELATQLLREPSRFGLTARERLAADVLMAWAECELKTRAVWATLAPIRDADDSEPLPEISQEQRIELWARREAFRRVALLYAQQCGNGTMVDAYAHPEPSPDDAPAPAANKGTPKALTAEQEAEIVRLFNRGRGLKPGALGKQFNVSRPTIDKALRRANVKT